MRTFFCLSILIFASSVPAQEDTLFPEKKNRFLKEWSSHRKMMKTQFAADSRYDVTYYKLDLTISAATETVGGSVLMRARCMQNSVSSINIDLMNSFSVDSVRVNGIACVRQQFSDHYTVTLDHTYSIGESIELITYYHGRPFNSGFGSFTFRSHGANNKPWIYTLSEPYGARDWWPNKDHPMDKADSADINITCDSTLIAASNGILTQVVNRGDGTKTYFWHESYPISTYLISVTISDFKEFTHWFRYSPTDSMPIVNYVLPEHYAVAVNALDKTPAMLKIYSDLFGLYPFYKEKYGHAEFGWGGAMEHQTLTSITYSFPELTVAHELAHQWFGDMITMRTWPDLWLNEGFATYCESLYGEAQSGSATYHALMAGDLSLAKSAVGSLYLQDTTDANGMFNVYLVYSKGSSVLHMLRHVLGDTVFFKAIKNYSQDSTLRYNNASTSDFRRVCEKTSGRDLSFFFSEWVYGERFPSYQYSWSTAPTSGGYRVRIHLSQTTGVSNPTFFTMPIDFKLENSGWDTTLVFLNNAKQQTFDFEVSHKPTKILLDPDNWILKNVSLIDDTDPLESGYKFTLHQNYPNPFNNSTRINYEIDKQGLVDVTIYNTLGQAVRRIVHEIKSAGEHFVYWDGKSTNGRNVSSGIYFCRLKSGSNVQVQRMVFLK